MTISFSVGTEQSISASVGDSVVVVGGQSNSSSLTFTIGGSTTTSSGSGSNLGSGSSTISTPATAASAVESKPRGMAWMLSTKSSGSVAISAKSTSGYITVLWWDGLTQVVGNGSPGSSSTASRAIATSGNWAGSSPKHVYVWSGNRVNSGELTSLDCSSCGLQFIDINYCPLLVTLDCGNNSLRSLSFTQSTALEYLYCHNNLLPTLSVSTLLSLKELYCHTNLLTALDVTKNTQLQSLQCNGNSLQTLTLTGLTSLASLYCHDNLLSFLDLRPALSLANLNCIRNRLTAVRATGLSLGGVVGASLSQNLLSAAALNTFYQDLSTAVGGRVFVSGNPGVASDNPSIAEAKGYTVYGT